MTTNRIGVKFLIAAATAGALIAGSGPGAMAAPPVAKPAKKTNPTVVLKSIDIKRHSEVNFYNVNPATDSPIKVTARFKDPSGKALGGLSAFTVTLAEYSKKVRGAKVDPPTVAPVTATLTWTGKGRKSKLFAGAVGQEQLAAISGKLQSAAGKSVLLCLSDITDADVTVTRSTKMKKRLDNGGLIAVGDCVRLVYTAPTTPLPSDGSTPPAAGGDSSTGGGSSTTPVTTTTPTTATPPAGSTTPVTTTTPTTATPPAGSTTPVTTTTPGKSAVVLVKPIDRGNKLYVNVNPNKGKGYWRFQVQRKKSDGTWKSLSTYRTKGKKETRTLDLKKGTYRVVVRPKYGYLGATSLEVTLKR